MGHASVRLARLAKASGVRRLLNASTHSMNRTTVAHSPTTRSHPPAHTLLDGFGAISSHPAGRYWKTFDDDLGVVNDVSDQPGRARRSRQRARRGLDVAPVKARFLRRDVAPMEHRTATDHVRRATTAWARHRERYLGIGW